MKQEKKLIEDTILYSIAYFGSSGLQIFMLPLYTRYFSPESFGMWDIVVTSATLLVPLITFELTAATYRWLLDEQSVASKETIISTGFFQHVRHMIVFTVIAVSLFLFLSFPFKWEALILVNCMIIGSFIQQCARGLKRNILFATLGFMQTIIAISLNLVFILIFKLGIESFFYANSIAIITSSIFAWKKLNFQQFLSRNNVSKNLLHHYLTYALPIIPAAVSWWVMTMADRWVIAYFLGVESNGVYAIALKIPAVLLMVNSVFSLAWKDSAITTYHTKEKDMFYTKTYQHYFRLMATTVICLTLLAKPAIAFFIGDAYYDAWKYTGLLLIATLFHSLALFWSAGFHGAKKTKAILHSTIIGAIINIGLNVLFIHFIGLYAVAISTIVSFLITWVMRVRAAGRVFRVEINILETFFFFIVMIIAGLIPFFIGNFGLLICVGLSFVLFIIINRKMVVYLFRVWG